MRAQNWSPDLYSGRHSFVWERAKDLLDWLEPKAGEQILDVGCGTGELTAALAESGVDVIGIDQSPDMVEKASAAFPAIRFVQADLTALKSAADIGADAGPAGGFDAVFSNATLHWIPEAQAAANALFALCKPGGRLVFEMGGERNIGTIIEGIEHAFGYLSIPFESADAILYFPSLATQAKVIEQAGFRIRRAEYFDRPTLLEEGEKGLRNWVSMFKTSYVRQVPEARREEFFAKVEEYCRPHLYKNGDYFADYRRLRMLAFRSN